MSNIKLPIETPNPLFGRYLYPEAKRILEQQQDKFWTAQEIPVEKDVHDYKQNLSQAQLNLATITLQIFVEIEQKVGDVWEQIATWYPHSEIEGCCSQISSMEKSVHAFFYQKMSDVMNIDPEETAKNQQTVSVLRSKLQFLEHITRNLDEDKLLSLATVALIEQVLLFSNFAMLKSFRSNGNNFIPNTVTGVDFVIFDESLHGEFATYLHNTHKSEHERLIGPLPASHNANIVKLVGEIISHEDAMIDYSFAGETSINGITSDQLKSFIRHRANTVLEMFGFDPYYTVDSNPIADWFYKGSKSIKVHDFFAGLTNQYRRGWSTESFTRLPHLKEASSEH
jgi:ribonucleoside-diphosphate reductase beta chain